MTLVSECAVGLVLFRDACVSTCPDYYFLKNLTRGPGKGIKAEEDPSWICLPCHYSCRTCSGSNEYDCLSCHDDSTLRINAHGTQSTCYTSQFLNSIESNEFWYKVLILIVILNVAVVGLLLLYIFIRRQGPGGAPNSNWLERRTYIRVSNDEDHPLDLDPIDITYSIPPLPSQKPSSHSSLRVALDGDEDT